MTRNLPHRDLEIIEPNPVGKDDRQLVELRDGDHVTRRQFLFIERFFQLEFDAPKAVVAAGYSTDDPEKKAVELMRNPIIIREITNRMKAIRETAGVTLQEVIVELWESARERGEGSQHSARVSALGNLARIMGGFEKDKEKDSKIVAINMNFNLEDEGDDHE